MRAFFSVGAPIIAPVREAMLTHLMDMTSYPAGARMIIRRERPQPGAQLSLCDTVEGMCYQAWSASINVGFFSLSYNGASGQRI